MALSLPRRYRVPNPPGLLVGRQSDIDWATSRLESAPLVVLTGPGGIGKTALALHLGALRAPSVFVAAQEGDPIDHVRNELRWALCRLCGRDPNAANPEDVEDEILSLADELGVVVILDDLHHVEPFEATVALLDTLATYARHAKFVVTSRASFDSVQLRSLTRELTSLSETSLYELATWIEPEHSSDHRRRAALAAMGSPLRLQQHLTTAQTSSAEQLASTDLRFLHWLCIVDVPLEPSMLEQLSILPEPEVVSRLIRHGWVAESPTGIHLHDSVARQLRLELGAAPELRAEVASSLATAQEPSLVLAAARILREIGALTELESLLEREASELLARGEAARLWTILASCPGGRLDVLRLQCAAELGNATVLSAVRQPVNENVPPMQWARALFLMGEADEAIELIDAAQDSSLQQLKSRCLLYRGQFAQAHAALGPSAHHDESAQALGLRIGVTDGTVDRAQAERDSLALLERLAPAQGEARFDIACVLERLGRPDHALRALEVILTSAQGSRLPLLLTRRALLLRTAIWIRQGRFADAGRQLELLRDYTRGSSILRPLFVALDVRLCLAAGGISPVLQQRLAGLPVQPDSVTAAAIQQLRCDVARELGGAESFTGSRMFLANDQLTEALRAAKREIKVAAKENNMIDEAEGCLAARDVCFTLRDLDAAREFGKHLALLGEHADSVKWKLEADFTETPLGLGNLERIAARVSDVPTAARRARCLLGGAEPLDAIDARVVDALMVELGGHVETLRGDTDPWSAGWGIDVGAKLIWLSDGGSVSFAKRARVWALLQFLADRESGASKEELINEVWGEPEYHPLRHDPKLQAAVRSTRKLIEIDPSQPKRLITTGNGYRLGGTLRRFVTR